MVAVATRKMIVSAASRMLSAISLGVFCRLAPSTSAIIRSMKLSPGRCVICTTIRSDSTLVPPVTAERSPPDSRMTGADSPVMADSSTLAMPSTTSPSPGMISPASTTTKSPCLSSGAPTVSHETALWPARQPVRRRAIVSRLAARSVAACALPRPSATASARLANTTVSQSQTTIAQAKIEELVIARTVVKTAPISTMNITGLRHSVAGFSLRRASGREVRSCLGSSRPPPTLPFLSGAGVRPGARSTGVAITRFLLRAARAPGRGGRSARPG